LARYTYIAIEGVIGVGKTTLARMMRDAFQAELLLEVFEENPFLSDFYADRRATPFKPRYSSSLAAIASSIGRRADPDPCGPHQRLHLCQRPAVCPPQPGQR